MAPGGPGGRLEQETGQQGRIVAGHQLLHLRREERPLHRAKRSPFSRLADQETGIPEHLQ
jgi:hypothetical protein